MTSGLDPEAFILKKGIPLLRRDDPITVDELDTGDIILMRGIGSNSRFALKVIGEPFSHICVVFKCPITGQKYVYETGPPQPNTGNIIVRKGGSKFRTHLMTLDSKLRWTDAFFACHRVFIKDPVTGQKRRPNFDQYQKFIWQWIADDLGRSYDYNHAQRMNERFGITKISLPIIDAIIDDPNSSCCPANVLQVLVMLGILEVNKEFADLKDVYCNEFIDMNSLLFIMKNNCVYEDLEFVKRIPTNLFFDPPDSCD